MIKNVTARLLGGMLSTAALLASPVPTFAINDGPARLSEDVSDVEISPPGSREESREDRGNERDVSEPSDSSSESPPSSPPDRVDRVDSSSRVDREAAKRALLSEPKAEKPNPLLDTRGPDYYDRRAKELLKVDTDKGRVDLHPLMELHPESFVVVCTAGCRTGESAQIVSMLPKRAATPLPPENPSRPEISCVGGCGNSQAASFASAPKPIAGDTIAAATVGEWMTTVAKTPAGAEPPAPKAGGSGEWMNKINQDRDTAKAAAAPAKADPVVPAKANSTAPEKTAQTAPAVVKPDAQPAAKSTEPAANGPALSEAKPAAEAKPVAAEPKTMASADAKPMADTKPAPAAATAPAPVAQVKPAPAPAAAPAPVAQVKPAPAPAPAPAPVQQATAPVEPKPAAAAAEPRAATAPAVTPETKATAQSAPPAPAPQQMAALETPKAPVAPAPVKATSQETAPAPTAKPEVKTPAASVAEQKPAATPAPPTETKVAALQPPALEKPVPVAPAAPKERVISVLSEDKDMNAAIEKARGSIASFWKSYEAPGPGETDHALKVAVAGNGTTEHFWLTRIKREDGKLSGVISNQPQSVKSVKIGQRYEFTADMVSDWTFKRNGKLVGNETMRVLLPRMPEEQASVYRQMYETP